MLEIEILMDWLSIDKNANKIPTVEHSQETLDFVEAHLELIRVGNKRFYKLGSSWYRIVVSK